jgi:hypothetical protein
MKYKLILFIAIFLMSVKVSAQQYRYFKDFDLSTMSGIGPLNENSFIDFYVKCRYDDSGKLTSVGFITKMAWEAYHSETRLMGVISKNDKTFLLLGSGKQRDGYTRALFQKKIYVSASAMVTHDTAIFKTIYGNSLIVQLFTNINTDSVFFKELTYNFNSKKERDASPFSSFEFYKDWFNSENKAELVIDDIIKLKQDTLLTWRITKGKTYRINITKSSFHEMVGMPISFLWLFLFLQPTLP